MITSAENGGWPGDVAITALPRTGLPVPSVIRPLKIATIDSSDATKLGAISAGLMQQVLDGIGRTLGRAD